MIGISNKHLYQPASTLPGREKRVEATDRADQRGAEEQRQAEKQTEQDSVSQEISRRVDAPTEQELSEAYLLHQTQFLQLQNFEGTGQEKLAKIETVLQQVSQFAPHDQRLFDIKTEVQHMKREVLRDLLSQDTSGEAPSVRKAQRALDQYQSMTKLS